MFLVTNYENRNHLIYLWCHMRKYYTLNYSQICQLSIAIIGNEDFSIAEWKPEATLEGEDLYIDKWPILVMLSPDFD